MKNYTYGAFSTMKQISQPADRFRLAAATGPYVIVAVVGQGTKIQGCELDILKYKLAFLVSDLFHQQV